jgi:DNA primase
MASIRDLKRDVNYVLGDIIEAVYMWELTNPDKDNKKSQSIIDEAIVTFDDLIAKINNKEVENRKQHLKDVSKELETRAGALVDQLNKL